MARFMVPNRAATGTTGTNVEIIEEIGKMNRAHFITPIYSAPRKTD